MYNCIKYGRGEGGVGEMRYFVAEIRLFFLKLGMILDGGMTNAETWRQKEALEEIIKRGNK